MPTPRATTIRPGFANNEPLLSVSQNSFILTRPLLAALNLGGKSRVRLVVPRKAGQDWFLDIAPRGSEGHQLPARGSALFRLPPIGRDRFMVSDAVRSTVTNRNFAANQNRFARRLYFELGEEVEPGYYLLVRRPAAGL
jgi:hypothetical protein